MQDLPGVDHPSPRHVRSTLDRCGNLTVGDVVRLLLCTSCTANNGPGWGQPPGTVVCMHAAVGLAPASASSASVSQLGVSAQPRDSRTESYPPPNPRAPIPSDPHLPSHEVPWPSFMQPRWDLSQAAAVGHRQDVIPTPLYHTLFSLSRSSARGAHLLVVYKHPASRMVCLPSSPHPASSSPASWVLPTTKTVR